MSRHAIDPSILESTQTPEALAWASSWSQATDAAVARADLQAGLRRVLDSDDRIPEVTRRGDRLYNFWRDGAHPRGLWRRTTLESYLTAEPEWEVLLDIDALAAAEHEDWVFKGASVCPVPRRALVRLSRGGADATVMREFDVEDKEFVDAGFVLPEAKTDISWIDEDSVIVGTDTGESSLTASGYPAQVRRWRRGEAVDDAEILATGTHDDVAIGGHVDPLTGRIVITRAVNFYDTVTSVSTADGQVVLQLPEDCDVTVTGPWLLLAPRSAYAGLPAGSLGAIELEDFLAGSRDVRTIFAPTPHTSLQSLTLTKNYLVLTVLEEVATRLLAYPLRRLDGPALPLALPELVTASVVSASQLDGDEVWISASSFTTPPALYRLDLAAGPTPALVKQAPARFDASGMTTRQHWAVSADGTRVPYFVTGRLDDGPRPTLVVGYGGFEVSLLPGYSGVRGVAWLERGGIVVQPNLRGGGEFGPAWHSQVTGRNRHKVWEDHEAVLRDVVARGYATPATLGIRGGSNGGLLTAGALTRYPEAFAAAVIQVPLTDMLRYHTWSAGASWMAEYGNPEDPADRAAIETWSPLHNVVDASERPYPPALVTTSTRDDRVHPAHARLFAHRLSAAGQPVDYYENAVGGHAGAADNGQVAHVESLIYQWLADRLG
ncbi:prolyl oligopeptidase family serine peptidase [Corynebacterium uterequi]|uniref:Serine protease, S9A family peptidase n=1 Tax=Corynebacterium uterequi TaxID=1072256 RepID=A0A0G3HA97_9CORY|nr:prolyl oligopeptidase family serine peptidase [Corynebacterium uterequi]AKK10239.1 serine protease, S9A family peptidase [Corynebacterium uterequi]